MLIQIYADVSEKQFRLIGWWHLKQFPHIFDLLLFFIIDVLFFLVTVCHIISSG